MKKINQYTWLLLAAVTLLFTACDEDDNTGYSNIEPTNPTVSITVASSSVTLVEKKSTYLFDVTLSEAQVTDIAIYASVVDGATATLGDDFTIDNGNSRVYIPAGKTTGTVSITVLDDELIEEDETFTIQIGDERTANATVVPVTVDFTLHNLTADDLVAGLSWETNVKDVIGLEKDADEVVDLRLIVLDASGTVVETVDSGSFEEYTFLAALADGVYSLAVDVKSTVNFGDYNESINLSLSLQFDQVGTINENVLAFDAVMNNDFVCELFRVNLATVTKTGSSYTIEKNVVKPSSPFAGTWSGDDVGYDSQVSTSVGCGLNIFGLNHGWMEDFWGEEVIKEENVAITFDMDAGTLEITEQNYITTLYDGDEYPYTIKGTGTIVTTGGVTTLAIKYELLQDGWNVNEYCFGKGYITTPTFEATITLD